MGHIYLKSEETFLPDLYDQYVKLSARVIKLIFPQDCVELSVTWNLNIEPGGVFSVAEQKAVSYRL